MKCQQPGPQNSRLLVHPSSELKWESSLTAAMLAAVVTSATPLAAVGFNDTIWAQWASIALQIVEYKQVCLK
jgi:hypothetical protein